MISIISINSKFYEISPKELVDTILSTKYTRGFEIYVGQDEDYMIDYMDQIVDLCRENNLRFQVHGNSSLDLKEQKEYLTLLTKYSDYLGYPINVVLHTLTKDSLEDSIHDSQEYFSELLQFIDESKIHLSIENLNDSGHWIRLDKNEMIPVMYNEERLYMTYDIGHDIADYGRITDLNPFLIDRISNIHIHTKDSIYDDGYDHKKIVVNGEGWDDVLKGILYLKNIKYDGPVVFEYDLDLCDGDTKRDKLQDFLKSIDEVSERL